ncbi:pantothenate transporter liz1/MFS transporter,putative [Blumeria hordei DH14]|uniref:Pantothenate transporter liz1/MFS transporter,putative n=1 Tax=Blumeria graminis f. sp. hordei (strain DH14) TaxID=546991 RepID=N1JGY8_BLUG1|nr:pantothenate transporter liz1/MFS transporter,putative [Blumeria hordei DH14]
MNNGLKFPQIFLTSLGPRVAPSTSTLASDFTAETASYHGKCTTPPIDAHTNSDLQSLPTANTAEKKLLLKIDLHILPCLCILYALAFLDRVNIANARSFGLFDDLKLYGNRFNAALTIFFVPYILFEIPSNIFLKHFSPRYWISGCMFMFGAVTFSQGFVQSYTGLLITRFLLGFFEAGMFPGCFYLIGMWYKRSEAQRRFSFFFNSTCLAGAFGGLLASAIGKMDGLGGYRGWRWIFIIEGLLTTIAAIVGIFFIPSFVEDSSWLSPEEKEHVKDRIRADQCLMYISMVVPAYGYAFFGPAIISTFKYSPIATQLHSVAPWVCAFVFSMTIASASDFIKHRLFFVIFSIVLAISGFIVLLSIHNNTSIQFGGLFLITSGVYSAMPLIICWFNMNLGGHLRRAVGSAWQIGFGNIGGIIATYAFLPKDAPSYTPGYAICLGFLVLGIFSCCIYALMIYLENERRNRALLAPISTGGPENDIGDKSPEYRYLL